MTSNRYGMALADKSTHQAHQTCVGVETNQTKAPAKEIWLVAQRI